MAIQKRIEIDGKEVLFKASAAIPRIYRLKYGRDIFKDLSKLENGVKANDAVKSNLDIESLEIFENIAFVMAKHADSSICEDTSEWLEQFNTFSIYQVLPQLIELWGLNVQSEAEQRKKYKPLKGK